ncbi:hypothetical protein HELRODRAFT_157080 [Helobdella robusta]|uniref:Peroxisomal biogenesis factor 3 n=1 Tax=Helobdella robusta TaxID=6412 RepID=T1EM60_HELRO|nr:hypothetical protein HELRODRAFT_157080 [Helobdella robusta]ESO03703.1 hypothetical protein HELRODRAFT_157080 [Helobdella robusta]
MLSSVWNFVKRHKKKFVFTGVLVGGIYYLGKYARRKIIEQQKQEALEFIDNMRKQQHYENSQRTCERTIISMLPNLCEALCKQLDTEHLLVGLKSKPDMKIATWEKIKLLSFVRMIVSVYSCCLLVLIFKVQLNINSNVQKRYMQCIQLLFKTVLKRIIADVTAAVSEVIGGLSLKTPMTPSTLHELLTLVRRKVEVKVQNGYHDTDLTVVCKSFSTLTTICLDGLFSQLLSSIAGHFEPMNTTTSTNTNTLVMSKPLAKVIPIVNGLVYLVTGNQPNKFVDVS